MKLTFETIWLFFHRPVGLEELLILYARVQFSTPQVSDYRLISKTANTAWVHASFVNYKKKCTRLASDKVYQLLAHGRWFSPGNPASSTTKTGRHDIVEILLKVALNTKKSINQSIKILKSYTY